MVMSTRGGQQQNARNSSGARAASVLLLRPNAEQGRPKFGWGPGLWAPI